MNNRMKRLTAILSALLLIMLTIIPLTGCGGDVGGDDEPVTTAEPEDAVPQPSRVGFIYSGTITDSAHNRMWEGAREAIERNLGAETYYVENVYYSNFVDAVNMLTGQGVGVIVSTSHFFASAVESVARSRPNVHFVNFGGSVISPQITVFQPLLFQPVHAAGFAAGHNLGDGVGSVGIVADARMFNAYGVINSFVRGVRRNFRGGVDAHVRWVYSRDEAQVRAAVDQLIAEGNNTILSYLDTEYAITHAERRGISVVGFSNNIAELAPINHVAGFYFNVNSYLTEHILAIENETVRPVLTYGELDTGLVNMSVLTSNVDVVSVQTREMTEFISDGVRRDSTAIFVDEIRDRHGTVQVPNGVALSVREVLDINWLEISFRSGSEVSLVAPRDEIPLVPLVVVHGENAKERERVEAQERAEAAENPGEEPE